jgi:hypothetical protein
MKRREHLQFHDALQCLGPRGRSGFDQELLAGAEPLLA